MSLLTKSPQCRYLWRNLKGASIFQVKHIPHPPIFIQEYNHFSKLTIGKRSSYWPQCAQSRFFSSELDFGEACKETLESITEYFEEIVESIPEFRNGDVICSDGVLTAHLGDDFGTYVINRQSPNQQIWLSSPTSGPKRYDLVDGVWIYKHDSRTLHSLLDEEIQLLTKAPIEFSLRCHLGKKE